MTETAQAYWKRFAASATDYVHRYRDDVFLRTRFNIIALQVAYALIMLVLAIGSLVFLYQDIVGSVVSSLERALTATTTPVSSGSIVTELEAVLTREIFIVSLLIFGAAVVFGYLIGRFALIPARNALAVQKQFIGNIAHELRTPLSIIKTNTEVRLLDVDVPKTAREVHESNLEELDRINSIINNLLSLNTLVQPERVPFENVDVGKVVHRVVGKLGHFMRRKPLRIRVKIARERVAWGNESAIEQIIMNIIKNSIHHTAKGEIVILVGADTDGMIELTVRDTGAGIKRNDLFRIFEPFYRGDRARTRSGGAGSGLGLAIVSELVKLHHGRVSIKSAPGKGTSVIVTLPPGRTREHFAGSDEPLNEVSADFSSLRSPRA